MDIIVMRGEGNHPGDDIVDLLMSDLSVGLSRGRAELDQGALADAPVLTCVLCNTRLGHLIQVNDTVLGTWRGKVVSVSHSIKVDDSGSLSTETQLTLRKPRG